MNKDKYRKVKFHAWNRFNIAFLFQKRNEIDCASSSLRKVSRERVRSFPSTPSYPRRRLRSCLIVPLYLRSPSSQRFTKGHTKLPFAVFVGRLANPLSHEAFSGKLYSICVPLWFLFFYQFLVSHLDFSLFLWRYN